MYQKPCVSISKFNISEPLTLDKAYHEALKFTKTHYENFPVASLFIPKDLRKHIAVVYQFARQADDIADEGIENEELRIENLELYKNQLSDSLNGKYDSPFWTAFHNTILQFNLTQKNFFDLLDAFKQDITKKRYFTFNELLEYCEKSANPVGRIILELHNINDPQVLDYSDAVCTALQLTNFYQDISVDYQKDRIYLPIEEMGKFGVTENIFRLKENNINFQKLLKYQVERTHNLFEDGKNILNKLPLRLRYQIKMTILGGEKILQKISQINYNVLNERPTLTKFDIIQIIFRTLIK